MRKNSLIFSGGYEGIFMPDHDEFSLTSRYLFLQITCFPGSMHELFFAGARHLFSPDHEALI
jgi:hypothetical protein